MIATHLYALIPLLVLLVLSLVFYGRGLVHLMTLSYVLCLGIMAVTNSWEIIFFPILVFTGIIATILFIYSMLKGDWL